MRKRLALFFLSSFLSGLFFLGLNLFERNVQSFASSVIISRQPQLASASLNQKLSLEKKQRFQRIKIEKLDITAKSAISVEFSKKGESWIVFQKNPDERRPIASLTKLMTALVVFDLNETYKLDAPIKITKKAIKQEGDFGQLREGEKLSVKNLLYIALIESSNDAAYALSELIGERAFVDLMNIFAKDIELENTHFFNPTGLEPDDPSEPLNYSTAQDLVKLSQYILRNYPQIFEITRNFSYEVFKEDGTLHHFIPENTNKLLVEFPEMIGGKTGWSPKAGGCLLTIIEEPATGNYFINVFLGSDDRFEDMRKIINEIKAQWK